MNSSNFEDHRACKFDFSSTTAVTYSDPDGSNHYLSSITAINDDHVIAGGFVVAPTPKYFFYRHNFGNSSKVWAIESAAIENVYSSDNKRRIFSFINDDSTKLFNILHLTNFPFVIVLNPSDGTLIDAKKIENSLTYGTSYLQGSGRISNNMIMASFTTWSPNYNPLTFINTDTWEQTSYVSENFLLSYGFTPLFSSDQIVLLFKGPSSSYFTLQAAYDKLHLTELYNQTTYTLVNVTENLAFNDSAATFSQQTESTASLSVTLSDATLQTESDMTYEVTANIFSSSVGNLTGDTNSTSLGPVEFDCYAVTTGANTANFSNQLSMTPSDGQAIIPSWMTFDSSTAGISLTSPEISSGTYTVTNSYTGVVLNFTLDTNVTINITEPVAQTNNGTNNDDDSYCLGASSEGLCAFFVILIIIGVLGPIILIAAFIYFKVKCSRGTTDRTRIDQEQPNELKEGEENNNGLEGDESAHMNQNHDVAPNTEIGGAQNIDDVKDNQV